ncbi:MAG: DUF3987 domain-containing protein, partial [Magnetococcus sp. DMHC-8]
MMDFNQQADIPSSEPRSNVDRLKASLLNHLESVLVHLLPAGKVRSGKFYVGDVQGNPGDSMVVELSGSKAGMWCDHATGQGGDIIGLWAEVHHLDTRRDFPKILDDIGSWLGDVPPAVPPKPNRNGPPVDELGPPTGQWDYHDWDGSLLCRMYRYDPPSGKQFRPWDVRARRHQAPEPRPLYNLPAVMASEHVILVEGEKCADALKSVGIVATTAMHGANAPVEKTDWSPLTGKHLLIWPDKDLPGWEHAVNVARAALQAGAVHVAILIPPGDKPHKWDAADAVADGMNVHNFLATAERQEMGRTAWNGTNQQNTVMSCFSCQDEPFVDDSPQDVWPDPTPISQGYEEPRPYPLDALPSVLRDAAYEVARFVKVPVASPAVIGLSVAALSIGKRAKIQERSGLYHHPALFHALIAASGERKSPPFKIMTRSLEQWIEGELDAYQQRVAEVSSNNQVLDTMLLALKKQASRPNLSEQEQQAFIRQMAQEECKRIIAPPHPRMFTSDATEERLF